MVGKSLDASAIAQKEIRAVVAPLLKDGWTLHKEGHGFRLYCPCDDGGCTTIPIGSTPANTGNAARRIRRMAQRCPLPPDDPNRSLTGRPRE